VETSERIDAERPADQKADAWGILVIFIAIVAGAVHFISGWTF
jgi:hypothetical protein